MPVNLNPPCPNDYGEELEQQAAVRAKKVAMEYQWSGREDLRKEAVDLVQDLLTALHITGVAKETRILEGRAKKFLTTHQGGV